MCARAGRTLLGHVAASSQKYYFAVSLYTNESVSVGVRLGGTLKRAHTHTHTHTHTHL